MGAGFLLWKPAPLQSEHWVHVDTCGRHISFREGYNQAQVAIGEATGSNCPRSASPGTSLLMTAVATGETTSRADEEIGGQEGQIMDPLHSSVTDDAGDREHSSGRGNEEARDNTSGDDSDRLGEIGAEQDSSAELDD